MHTRTRRLSSAVASAAALALLVPPAAAIAAPDPDEEARGTVATKPLDSTAGAAPSADPADKISPAAEKTFAARGTTDYWLRFDEEPDLSAADGITVWSERGQYVYDVLTAAAEKAQASTVAELEQAGAEYTSYWAANAILVEDGTFDEAVELAADSDVVEVRPTARYSAPDPVEVADTDAAETDGPTTWGLRSINADDMWAAGFTGDGVVVANLDSGVAGDHSALAAKYRGAGASNPHAYNYFSADGRYFPHDTDADSHGTHTMGTMVAGTVVSNGVERAVGVAPGAQWIAAGIGDDLSDETLVAAGQWLLAPYDQATQGSEPDPGRRPHVINNSWGASFSTDPFMENLITAWEAAGIFSTFANGNAGGDECSSAGSPASRQANYAVGAFGMDGEIAPFSSRGPGQSGTVKPDIAAPGVDVLSTTRTGSAHLNGTSMAAPHVAGAVALLWDAVPDLVGDVPATRAILDASAHDKNDTSCGGTADDNNVWGEGKLDVLAAYRLTQDEDEFEATPAPVISGDDYRVGVPLTATSASWTPAASFAYQWRRDGRAISGATETTYTPTAADADTHLTVTATGTADGRIPTTATSAETREITEGVLEWSTPTISGTHRVGSTLRAHAGSWTPGTTFTYQWLASSEEIAGADGPTYTPTREHLGAQITVQLNASRRGYLPRDVTSEGDGIPIVTSGLISQPKPVIVGRATPGATLTVSRPPSVASPDSVSYRWRLDGQSIRGATKSTLIMRSEWRGHVITVSVTVKKSGYDDTTVTSAGARVGGAYSRSPNPVISGTARVGSRLTAVRGTWSPTPTTFSFQWYADGRPISGATTSRYALKGTDYKKEITVSVRTYRAGYGTVLRRSAATNEVLASADRWRGEGEREAVPAGPAGTTYIAQAGSAECYWRQNQFGGLLGSSVGSGQRLLTVQPTTTNIMASESCGLWIKYYPGMVRTSDVTAAKGVYVLGDHLGRGEYSTSGPANADIPCEYYFYKDFEGRAASVISRGVVPEATTITMPDSATGFETVGCTWQRIN